MKDEIEVSIEDQIVGWLTIYLGAHYNATGLEYRYEFLKNGRRMVLCCGESKLKLKIDREAPEYDEFVKEAMRVVTVKEQRRIRQQK